MNRDKPNKYRKIKREQQLKRIYKIKNIVFFTVLGIFAVIGALWFLRPKVSEIEKRALTAFPKFTLSGLIDGSFTEGIDQWYSDTYPLRDPLISGAHQLQALYGDRSEQFIVKNDSAEEIPDPTDSEPATDDTEFTSQTGDTADTAQETPEDTKDTDETDLPDGTVTTPGEIMGSVYVSGDGAYSLYYFSKMPADQYARLLNRTHQVLGEDVQVYSLIAPLSSGVVLDQSLAIDVGASDQREAIEYINSQMASGVHALNIFDTLKQHNAEYIYFRTDHHWTALGAYYAYVDFCKEKGLTPHALDQFEERNYPGFLGYFYSETLSSAMKNHPDTVTAYVPVDTNNMTFVDVNGAEMAWEIITDVEDYDTGAKYYCFAGADQPLSYVHNPRISDGSACVVIKDSYGNAFVPFLVDHYEYIYWIDFRYYDGTLTDLVHEKDIRDVIYCLDIYNTTSSDALAQLDRLVPEQ